MATRRSPGEGGVFEYLTKSGQKRYGIRFWVTLPDGSRKPVLRRRGPNGETWTTKRAANAAIRAALTEAARGQWAEPSRMALGEYLDRWLPGLRLESSTVASYRKNMRLHVVPTLGRVPLAKLTPDHFAQLYRELETTLSARTVRYIHTIIHKALDRAVRQHLMTSNPVAVHPDDLGLPTAKQAKSPDMQTWTPAELVAFLSWGRGEGDYVAWLVKVSTGVRRGELLALRWRDLDLDAPTVSVGRSLGAIREKGQPERIEIGSTKTDRPRVVDLDADTVAALRSYRRERASLSLVLVRPDALVFSDANGQPLHPDRFSRRFVGAVTRCRRELGEVAPPPIRLHDLRHTHATQLIKAGTPIKVVSERLGHASPMITLTVYAHVMPGMQRQAADTFAALLRTEQRHQSDITGSSGRTL